MGKVYEIVIGLEVHVELATQTKLFCGCSTAFGGAPNTHTCPVCTGMPGALPVPNRKVLEHAVAVGLATNCTITRFCKFDRKNYFYPDNPQNYQISQLYSPICRNGQVDIETSDGRKSIRIHEIHMEEDAGKLFHDEKEGISLIDYNRSGVPLLEIVSEPDFRNAEEVIAYVEKLRMIVQYLGASDGKLNEGSLRVDVNLSVREAGQAQMGTRTELKNLASFRSIRQAISAERDRQIALLESGEAVLQETRRWDEDKETSFSMRSKEETRDYRYFPEPDLVPIVLQEAFIDRIRAAQPEFREEKIARYKKRYDLPAYDAGLLTASKQLADLFEATVAICHRPKQVSNWLLGETLRLLKERDMNPEEIRFSPQHLADLIELTEQKTIHTTVAKAVFVQLFDDDIDPVRYVQEKGLQTVHDEAFLLQVIEEVIAANPQSVSDYQSGKKKAIGFLVGQTMKATKGKADPTRLNQLLLKRLS